MDHRDRILEIVKESGPLLPGQINKALRTNVLFASAMLSEMVDNKKIKLTSMKVGGSPLYYCDGQEPKLENFASRLEQKEFKAYELLRKSRILRDRDHDPNMRVSLREIKDFAIPLEVTANGTKDLFWKYFTVPDAEAEGLIKDYLNKNAAPRPADPSKAEPQKESQAKLPVSEPPKAPEQKPEPVPPENMAAHQQLPEQRPEPPIPEYAPGPQPKPETIHKEPAQEVQKPVTTLKMQTLAKEEVADYSYAPAFSFSTLIDTDEKVSIEKQKPGPALPQPAEFPEDEDFFDQVNDYFKERGIEILEFWPVRKNSEYEFVISVPTNIGDIEYYCRAKQKTKVTEMDLSPAFVQGQLKKIPVLFLSNGDPTSKTDEMLKQDFKSIVYRKLE